MFVFYFVYSPILLFVTSFRLCSLESYENGSCALFVDYRPGDVTLTGEGVSGAVRALLALGGTRGQLLVTATDSSTI